MRPNRLAALNLLVLATCWARIDKKFEGPKLVVFGQHHALVTADLVSVVLGLVALWCWFGAGSA